MMTNKGNLQVYGVWGATMSVRHACVCCKGTCKGLSLPKIMFLSIEIYCVSKHCKGSILFSFWKGFYGASFYMKMSIWSKV